MDDFDDDEWAEMQEMYINHTFKELNNGATARAFKWS